MKNFETNPLYRIVKITTHNTCMQNRRGNNKLLFVVINR